MLAFVRHLTTYRLVLILAGAAVGVSAPELTAAAAPRTSITVRVYQTAGLSSTLEQRALAETETALRAAFVDVRWEQCTSPTPSSACDMALGPSEFLLVVQRGAPCQETSATLGRAFVVRRAGGVLANVYFQCVASLASVSGTDVAVLLGRVAAHELGHLMMRTSSHARRGLMRENWTPKEVRQNLAVDWAFTPSDVAAMRRPPLD